MKNYKYLKIFFSIFLVLGISTSAAAADISGSWIGKMDNINIRLILKEYGSSLAGKLILSDLGGGLPIMDLKIDGNKISFKQYVGGSMRKQFHMTITYEGTITGNIIHGTSSSSRGITKNFTLEKTSSVRELNAKVVDGLGRPLKDTVITVQWFDTSNKDDIRTVDLVTLRSDEKGNVKGTWDESEHLTGSVMFKVEKPGYQGYSSSGWRSEYVLKRGYGESDLTRIAGMDGDAQVAELGELLSGDFELSAQSLEVQIFELENKLRASLRELVKDKKVGTKAGQILAFIGTPEDIRHFLKYAQQPAPKSYTNRWTYQIVTAMLDPTTEEEWGFLRDCAVNKFNDRWADAGAIQTLKLIASPRSRKILMEAKQKNVSRARYIDRAIAYIDSNPQPLSDADLVTAGKKVAEVIKIGNWEGNKEPLFNRNHDMALIDFKFVAGRDLLIYTATFHKVKGVWKLRGVRETMQAFLAQKSDRSK